MAQPKAVPPIWPRKLLGENKPTNPLLPGRLSPEGRCESRNPPAACANCTHPHSSWRRDLTMRSTAGLLGAPQACCVQLQPRPGRPRDRLQPTVGKEGTQEHVPGFLCCPPPLASEEDTNQRTEAGWTPSPTGLTPLFSIRWISHLDAVFLPHGHLWSQGTNQSAISVSGDSRKSFNGINFQVVIPQSYIYCDGDRSSEKADRKIKLDFPSLALIGSASPRTATTKSLYLPQQPLH